MSSSKPRTIFVDADDTLWENEQYFRDAEARFAALLAPSTPVEEVQHLLWEKQEVNIPLFGYGSKTYLIALVGAAIDLCGGSIIKETFDALKQIIVDLAFHKVEVFDGVEDTLGYLSERYRLVLATKGDMVEQLHKVDESGLRKYFDRVEIMKSKEKEDYLDLCHKCDVEPSDLVMVGNSVRSDVAPVIALGGTAIYIPHEIVWVHELAEAPNSDKMVTISNISCLKNIF